MSAMIRTYVNNYLYHELTIIMTQTCTAVGFGFGILKATCQAHDFKQNGELTEILAIGTFIRYPIQYSMLGWIAGIAYPITFTIPPAYQIYYMCKRKTSM
jgi:hypothetical protein